MGSCGTVQLELFLDTGNYKQIMQLASRRGLLIVERAQLFALECDELQRYRTRLLQLESHTPLQHFSLLRLPFYTIPCSYGSVERERHPA